MIEDGVNILLVDDQPEGLVALEAILKDLGQNLVLAKSGLEALRHVLDTNFALILLDVQMPGMNGFETAEAIRQRERSKHTPIIFLTAAYRSDVNVFQGYASGAVDYMFKPVEPEILRSKVRVFIELALRTGEVHRLNQTLERQAVQLEATNKDLQAFAYSVSHDLRAPLRHIDGFSRLLQEELSGKLSSDAQNYLGRIVAAVQRMSELIEDLLVISRVAQTEMRPSHIDLSSVAHAVMKEIRQADPQRKLEFIVHPGLEADADPGLIRIVIENLLGNAWKYTGKLSKAVIEVGNIPDPEGKPIFYVRDNGVGFDMRHMEQLFTPFRRLHPSTEFEGTGIGLATVDRIIRRHGGQVSAEAEVNKGATFYFTLPSGGISS